MCTLSHICISTPLSVTRHKKRRRFFTFLVSTLNWFPSGHMLFLSCLRIMLTLTKLMGDILHSSLSPHSKQLPFVLFWTHFYSWTQPDAVTCCTWFWPDSLARPKAVSVSLFRQQIKSLLLIRLELLLLDQRFLLYMMNMILSRSIARRLHCLNSWVGGFCIKAWGWLKNPSGVVIAANLHCDITCAFTIYLCFSV